MADTGAPLNIPLLGDGDAFAPFETPINAAAVAVNNAWNGLLSQAYLRYPTKAALILAPGTVIGQHATVWNDATTPANNGDYAWSGTTWIQVSFAGAVVPFAQAAGFNAAVAVSGVTTITFPVGRFTVAPVVEVTVVTATGGTVSVPWRSTVATTTNFGVRIFTLGGAQSAGTIDWTAVQMTPTSATG